ncbi:MAG: Tetratricopeptide repeat [Abditibacteriota bacterium]|nr:Tetratricopeptide repeat [Abditibacteriota bacterium]
MRRFIATIAFYTLRRQSLALLLAALSTTLLGGCTTSTPSPSSTLDEIRPAASFSEVVKRALRSSHAGRSYDRGLQALRRNDDETLLAAANEMRRAGAEREAQRLVFAAIERNKRPSALTEAERAVLLASALDSQAQRFSESARNALRERSTSEYRRAQRLMPKFDSDDPMLLNALGYFLAERGSTPQDFREAERLTRRALQLYDKMLTADTSLAEATSGIGKTPEAETQRALEEWAQGARQSSNKFSQANTRDSLAWALFRQKRYAEAAREQERAVREAQSSSRAIEQPMPPELHFHLGEIYRALKRNDEARRQYEAALRLNPEDPSRAALDALNRATPQADSLPTRSV